MVDCKGKLWREAGVSQVGSDLGSLACLSYWKEWSCAIRRRKVFLLLRSERKGGEVLGCSVAAKVLAGFSNVQ